MTYDREQAFAGRSEALAAKLRALDAELNDQDDRLGPHERGQVQTALACLFGARIRAAKGQYEDAFNGLALAERVYGDCMKRLMAENFETGEKIARATRKGHETKYGTAREKGQRWAEYQRSLVAKMERNPRLSLTEARRQVAKENSVSVKTIERHTRDPRKK